MRISDWSSDVCSSDLAKYPDHHVGCTYLQDRARLWFEADRKQHEDHTELGHRVRDFVRRDPAENAGADQHAGEDFTDDGWLLGPLEDFREQFGRREHQQQCDRDVVAVGRAGGGARSEEHTSELQSLMRISYAVFCLKKKKE